MQPPDAIRVVADGYDRIAGRYRAWSGHHDTTRGRLVDDVVAQVPADASVVELGCGSGDPVGRRLAQRYRYVGVDLSARQLDLARVSLPDGAFVLADLSTLELAADSVDAIVACYVMGHVPLARRPGCWGRVGTWLRPGGWFFGSISDGSATGEGVERDWLGVPMFFASMTWEDERRLIEGAGLEIVDDEVLADEEDGHPVAFRWLRLRRPE